MTAIRPGSARLRLGHVSPWAVLVLILAGLAGCASNKMAELRPVPKNPLVDQLKLTARGGPQPSDRTMQFLRVYDLTDDLQGDPKKFLGKVQEILQREPSADKMHTMAELAYLQAKRVEAGDPRLALDFYGASVLHAYRYLFDDRFRDRRNPYDPHFRAACELYNASLEAGLRQICKDRNGLTPGSTYTIRTAEGNWDITCALRSDMWRPEDFGRFEFVSDYEIKGLKNQYQTYGLGVPLIAVRGKGYEGEPRAAQYYPADLSFPVTAFLRPASHRLTLPGDGPTRHNGLLELYDPLTTDDITVAGVQVPLESDLTTPLGYFLSNPKMDDLPNAGLLRPDKLLTQRAGGAGQVVGLYMIQPYSPGKIPVLMVHGLWSSPMTWMAMFNDLRSCPEIRDRYQFWFYLYPTAHPFWLSAARLRRELAEIRQVLDPRHEEPALDQMVLIGHSMGGLVSRLQTLPSGHDYWRLVSDKPLDQIHAEPAVLDRLAECFYFQPNPSIRRVITVATPHHGSSISNQTTQWLAGKLIQLPQVLMQSQEALFRDNKGAFPDRSLLRIPTSVDSLSPATPIFAAMAASPRPQWVAYHNIIGVLPQRGLIGSLAGKGDGVVDYDSAHTDDAASELVVPAGHSTVHSHPLAVLEVRRILLDHLIATQPPADAAGITASRSMTDRYLTR